MKKWQSKTSYCKAIFCALYPPPEERGLTAQMVNSVAYGGERVILTRKGKKLVAIIPLEDFEIFEALEDRLDLSVAKLVDKDIEKHGTISWEEAKRIVDVGHRKEIYSKI